MEKKFLVLNILGRVFVKVNNLTYFKRNYESKRAIKTGRDIWGSKKLNLGQIIVCMGKVLGDICRWERDAVKDQVIHSDESLKKELGNLIFSAIRWCDDLGYDPDECIGLAVDSEE